MVETATEPTLFEGMAKTSLQRAFEQFDAENPAVWIEFRDSALRLIEAGRRHYGAKSIMETIRFHRDVRRNAEGFKINNNFTAYYARKFMDLYPEHEGFFETRAVRREQSDEQD